MTSDDVMALFDDTDEFDDCFQGRSQDLEKGGAAMENFWLTTPLIVSRDHGQLMNIQPRPPVVTFPTQLLREVRSVLIHCSNVEKSKY